MKMPSLPWLIFVCFCLLGEEQPVIPEIDQLVIIDREVDFVSPLCMRRNSRPNKEIITHSARVFSLRST